MTRNFGHPQRMNKARKGMALYCVHKAYTILSICYQKGYARHFELYYKKNA